MTEEVSPVREQLKSAFSDVGLRSVNADILSKCVGLVSTLHITPQQMAEYWETYSLNHNVNELTDHTFQAYRNVVKKQADDDDDGAVVSRPALGKRQAASTNMVTPPNKRALRGDMKTPVSAVDKVTTNRVSMSPNKVTPHQTTPDINLPTYGERKNAGQVLVTFNPHDLPAVEASSPSPSSSAPRCVVSSSFHTNVTKPYRHMFTTMEERANALDEHLNKMGEAMVERYEIGKDDGVAALEVVGIPRQDTVCCIGRVCNEAHEGRINQTSVLLEGSRHTAGGRRVNVDLSELQSTKISFSLFPGQIVAVEGMNVSGRKMVAHRICEGAAHPPTKSTVETLLHHHYDTQDGRPLKIMSMCGPYTTSDNLDYEPLNDIINVISVEKPDVVIMAGPFVDMRHSLVASGELTLTPEDEDDAKVIVTQEAFFANKVAVSIEQLFSDEQGLNTQFVLIPSLDDAVAEWVYPQAPLTDRLPNGGKALKLPNAEGLEFGTLGLHHIETVGREGVDKREAFTRVHRVSNPCTLKINELVVGVTSTDVLFHLNADETNANLPPGSRLGRIAQHMLQQQSYYPLFPPPASRSISTNLDLKHMEQWSMPLHPDLLIVPSKLTCFARTVLDSTVVVNPGHLSKGTTGGSYAVMDVHPIKRETLESAGGDDVELAHNAQDRIRVEIKRI